MLSQALYVVSLTLQSQTVSLAQLAMYLFPSGCSSTFMWPCIRMHLAVYPHACSHVSMRTHCSFVFKSIRRWPRVCMKWPYSLPPIPRLLMTPPSTHCDELEIKIFQVSFPQNLRWPPTLPSMPYIAIGNKKAYRSLLSPSLPTTSSMFWCEIVLLPLPSSDDCQKLLAFAVINLSIW